jgi:hypothetical protein
MDDYLAADAQGPAPGPDAGAAATATIEKTSARFVGRWNRLVSTTNWEKGRIISEWRQSLTDSGAPPQAYSDEAWSSRTGGVSPQHVGRLRRVYDRFGGVYKQYRGLFWSHFYAALDWDDAEMWLEGAVQNRWSVAQMRTTRWDAQGAPPDKKPKPEDVIVAELDEDVDLASNQRAGQTVGQSTGFVQGLVSEDADASPKEPAMSAEEGATLRSFRPFEDLPHLPADLFKAFVAFRGAIRRHQRSGWREVSREDVVMVLNALKRFVLASGEG